VVAIDVLELALGPGIERVERLGGISAWTGWRGPAVAVACLVPDRPGGTGWRSPDPPRLIAAGDAGLRVRSAIDGAVRTVGLEELEAWAARLGLEGPVVLRLPAGSGAGGSGDGLGGDPRVAIWDDLEAPPAAAILATDLPLRLAREGRRLLPDIGDCGCPACAIASRGLVRHLWEEREITAVHLLLRHNLHAALRLVAGLG
jgi:hypothetical protein